MAERIVLVVNGGAMPGSYRCGVRLMRSLRAAKSG